MNNSNNKCDRTTTNLLVSKPRLEGLSKSAVRQDLINMQLINELKYLQQKNLDGYPALTDNLFLIEPTKESWSKKALTQKEVNIEHKQKILSEIKKEMFLYKILEKKLNNIYSGSFNSIIPHTSTNQILSTDVVWSTTSVIFNDNDSYLFDYCSATKDKPRTGNRVQSIFHDSKKRPVTIPIINPVEKNFGYITLSFVDKNNLKIKSTAITEYQPGGAYGHYGLKACKYVHNNNKSLDDLNLKKTEINNFANSELENINIIEQKLQSFNKIHQKFQELEIENNRLEGLISELLKTNK